MKSTTKTQMKTPLKAGIIIAVVVVAALLYLFYAAGQSNAPVPYSFTVNNRTYQFTAVASNISEEEKGLMNATINSSTFMLFDFQVPGIYSFWMKDTPQQLDMIWISGNSTGGRVVYIANATPYNATQNELCNSSNLGTALCPDYTPNLPENYVIEAKAGFVQENNITLYTRIGFNYR